MLNLVDYSVSGFPLLFVGFLECLAVNWIYGELMLSFFKNELVSLFIPAATLYVLF